MANQNGKVYSALCAVLLGPGGVYQNTFILRELNRRFNLKSIFWDVFIKDNAGMILPIDSAQEVGYVLNIGNGPGGDAISYNFENFLLPLTVLNNGSGFNIRKPRKINWDNWSFQNQIPFAIAAVNYDLLVSYAIEFSLVVEIELL